MLYENYEQVVANVKKACERSGRNFQDITIIAVSKTKPLSDVEELLSHGVMEFGENKVQEMVDKYEHVSKPVHWHLIGHLQTNKVKYIVDKACLIHSVDSVHLAKEIEKQAAKQNVTVSILVEVNIAEEESKFGIHKEETISLIRQIAALPHIQILGLMTIAPFVENPEDNRTYFRQIRQLSVDIDAQNIDNVRMDILSMGMTGDYMVAIEEGATMVRVGTGIFGERHYQK